MAVFKKPLSAENKQTVPTSLYEYIPITGTLMSGTTFVDNPAGYPNIVERNVKNLSHGKYQAVYDYSFLSSSANHIVDITTIHHTSSFVGDNNQSDRDSKTQMYNELAQICMGFDIDGNVRAFDEDGNFAAGTKIDSGYVINYTRLLQKDSLRRGTYNLTLRTSGSLTASHPVSASIVMGETTGYDTITDIHASPAQADPQYFTHSPLGDFATLRPTGSNENVGLIFYQAGIVVLTASVFANVSVSSSLDTNFVGSKNGYQGALGGGQAQATLAVVQNNIGGETITLTPETDGGAAVTLLEGAGQDFQKGTDDTPTQRAVSATNIANAINAKTNLFSATSSGHVVTVSRHAGASGDTATATISGGLVTIVDFGTAPSGTSAGSQSGVHGASFLGSSSISGSATILRALWSNNTFQNTTELNSTMYFCHIGSNDFNYSSNPTYLDSNGKIRTKQLAQDLPVSYFTTVGLYSEDGELMAVAKLSEPMKKTYEQPLTLRVRLDY
jgi:hypothetical protein